MALDAEGGRQINDDSDSDVDDGDTSFSRPTTARRGDMLSPTTSIFQSAIDRILAPIGRLRFSVLLRTILQDTQTRLVFRAQAIVQTDVFRFIPTTDDLDYPAILEKNSKAISFWDEDDLTREFDMSGFRAPREEVQITWYHTLKRTVWVLSKLHTYVNVRPLSSLLLVSVAYFDRRSKRSSRTLLEKLSRYVDNRSRQQRFN